MSPGRPSEFPEQRVLTRWSLHGARAAGSLEAGKPVRASGLAMVLETDESIAREAFPCGSDGKESTCSEGDVGLIPGLGRSPWRREWQPTPGFLPGEPQGRRSLAAYSPRGCNRVGYDFHFDFTALEEELKILDFAC